MQEHAEGLLVRMQEATLLEEIAVQHSASYDFVAPGNQASKIFGDLFDALVRWAAMSTVLGMRGSSSMHADTHASLGHVDWLAHLKLLPPLTGGTSSA